VFSWPGVGRLLAIAANEQGDAAAVRRLGDWLRDRLDPTLP